MCEAPKSVAVQTVRCNAVHHVGAPYHPRNCFGCRSIHFALRLISTFADLSYLLQFSRSSTVNDCDIPYSDSARPCVGSREQRAEPGPCEVKSFDSDTSGYWVIAFAKLRRWRKPKLRILHRSHSAHIYVVRRGQGQNR